jgi:hypothetical protein
VPITITITIIIIILITIIIIINQGSEVTDVVLWLKTPTELAWSTDLTSFPPLVITTLLVVVVFGVGVGD